MQCTINVILNIFPHHFFVTEQQIIGDAVHKLALPVVNIFFYLSTYFTLFPFLIAL